MKDASRVLVSLTAFLVALAPTAATASPASDKVSICHVVQGKPGFVIIEIAVAALPAHLAHGDRLDCGDPCALPTGVATCGGFAGAVCPAGATCFDVPGDSCSTACGQPDCIGFCADAGPTPCGPGGACPPGFSCIDDPRDSCAPDCGDVGCATVCARVDGTRCGTIAGLGCPSPEHWCADDPGDGCDFPCGADCSGTCVDLSPAPCDCASGFTCPDGYACADDPRDACDPDCGGVDCPRICVRPVPPS